METEICLQLKCSVSLPVVIDCQKDSGTTVENGTQVKPVLLTAIRFAVYVFTKYRFSKMMKIEYVENKSSFPNLIFILENHFQED